MRLAVAAAAPVAPQDDSKDVWVYLQREGDSLSKESLELLAAGKKVAGKLKQLLVGILLGLGAVAILFLFVYPTSSFLRQRDDLNRARERLEVLRSETTRLDDATKKLQSDAEVERIAREQYGLVRPGEQSYVVIPATTTTTTPPPAPTAPGGLPNRQP